MPKLSAAKAKEVSEAESSFPLLESGWILLKLVEVTTGEGEKGPYWSWVFKLADESSERRFWQNTSLSPGSQWKMRETFEAFGVPTDTHTDDLIGQVVKAEIGVKTIAKGPRAGKLDNTILQLVPKDHAVEDPASDNGKSKSTEGGTKSRTGGLPDDDEPPF